MNVREELKELIEIADKCKNAYFWHPESNAYGRRSKEKYYSRQVEWSEGGHDWLAETEMTQSCHHVYFHTYYTKDGKKTNLTAVKNSYKRLVNA